MATFGRYLAQERELRALSREDVARLTRLSVATLTALEEDRFGKQTGDAFAVGHIRSIARCIGLNPDDAVLRYREARQAESPAPPAAVKRPLAAKILRAAIALLALSGLAAGALRLLRH